MTDLVRVRIGDVEKNVGAAFAEAHDLNVLDEPTHRPDGTIRRDSEVTKATETADSPKEPAPKKTSAKAADGDTAKEATK